MKDKLNKTLNYCLPVLSVGCVIAVWAVTAVTVDNAFVLPGVWETLKTLFRLFGDGEFYLSLLYTLLRSLIAFALSFTLSVTLGYLSVKSARAGKVLRPLMGICRALPTVAVVLLLVLWTNSFIAPIVVTMLVVMPTLYTGAINAFNGVDGELIEMCKVYGVDKREIFFKVKLPAVTPDILRLSGAGLSLNLKLMVAAEVLSATSNSLGQMLKLSQVYFETANMLALVLVVVFFGVLTESAFNIIARRREKKYL